MSYLEHIEIHADIRFGRPCVRGTRISVYDVLGWLASGMSHSDIIEDFPKLNNTHILACLAYAAEKSNRIA
jgi:uncharacterized protein (DUF433 family)